VKPEPLDVSRNSLVARDTWLRLYAVALVAVAVALLLWLIESGRFVVGDLPTAIGLSLVALVVERRSVTISEHLEISISALPILFAALALGPGAAVIVSISALLPDFRPPFTRWLIWTASKASIAGLAGVIASEILARGRASLLALFIAALAIAAFEAYADLSVNAATVSLRGTGKFTETISSLGPLLGAALPLYAPLLAVVAYAYQQTGPWAALFMLIPSMAAQRLFVLYREQRQLASQLTDVVSKLERVTVSFATAMVAALDARDHYTAGHSATVAVYARDTAREMGLTVQEQEQAHLCGLLHDVGKIGIPTELLEKRGPLTTDERLTIEMHADIGAAILYRVEGYTEIANAVLHHHEHFSGDGYPAQMVGCEIPLLSRIVAVADAYSAMTSERPYRIALSGEEARRRLLRGSGNQFDPVVIDAFIAVLDHSSEAYALGTHTDFAIEARELRILESEPQPIAV
jgi:putative nucleotidyltransferase with HDIG domain